MAEIYAPDFSGALYRHMLDYAVGGLDGPEDSETARGNLLRWVKALHGIVPEHLLEKIREIAKQEPSHYPLLRGRAFGFLSHESAQAKEAEDLRCDDLDDEVRWMK